MDKELLKGLAEYHAHMSTQLREAAIRARMRPGCGLHYSADRHDAWLKFLGDLTPENFAGSVTIGLMHDGRWSVDMNGARAIARKGTIKFTADGKLDLDTDHGEGPEDAARFPKVGEPVVPFEPPPGKDAS